MTNIAQIKEENMSLPQTQESMSVEERNRLAWEEYSSRQTRRNESKELNKLFEALSKAQLEMPAATNQSTNPFYKSKYADLKTIVQTSRPYLAKHGLCVIQRTLNSDKGYPYIYSILGHSSGQWIESHLELKPPKTDIQSLGSYMSYLRRYQYASLVGVVTSDEDDDGEEAMKAPRSNKIEEENNGKITKAQLQVLSQELESIPELVESILTGFSISKLSDLPAKKYSGCIERIRDIKRAKES